MIRDRNRIIYKIVLIMAFLVLNALVIYGISQVLSYLHTGADRTEMAHLFLKKEKVYFPKISWEDTLNPGRPMEKQTLVEIEENYLNAWYVRNVAYKTNVPFGIEEYYTQHARQNLYAMLEDHKAKNIHIEATTIDHTLSLDFYSADGQLVVLTDQAVDEYQRIYQNDNLILETKIKATYKVILLLEDGFWKIRHMTKGISDEVKKMTEMKQLITVQDSMFIEGGKSFMIKGINYYPQQTPWDMFGNQFDIQTIGKDLEIIKNAGLNTIRIFVPFQDFGKTIVKEEKLKKLKKILDQAEAKELKVIVTLFDFYGDYSVLDWTVTHRHAEQIVSNFKNHQAILAWDVKNEPNLDFENRGKTIVLAWLKEMVTQIRRFDPNHLITIGWSNVSSANLLQDAVDFVSFHYYNDIDNLETDYISIQQKTDKPVVLQEFGLSTDLSIWNPFGASENGQANYYKVFQEQAQKTPMHYLSWTLYDFKEIPSAVVGNLPWRKYKQQHFGFINIKGEKKPAFEFIGL